MTSMRAGWLWEIRAVVLATAVLASAGCSGAAGNDAAAGRVAQEFSSALAAGDPASACDLLAMGTVTALEQESGSACADALGALDLPVGGSVGTTRAFARAAESVVGADTLFLTLEPGGWKVRAAGCTKRPERPYHCDLKGD